MSKLVYSFRQEKGVTERLRPYLWNALVLFVNQSDGKVPSLVGSGRCKHYLLFGTRNGTERTTPVTERLGDPARL